MSKFALKDLPEPKLLNKTLDIQKVNHTISYFLKLSEETNSSKKPLYKYIARST